MLPRIPSLVALRSHDASPAEIRCARLRKQAAIVRALADHVEHLGRPGEAHGLRDQLVEETTRLACQLIEVAGSIAESPAPSDSGVFARSK
jgi:hypothetical protein